MAHAENYLHTTHRTVSWFSKAHRDGDLELAAPFQRNPVWTVFQKSYLIDTILQGLPVPELYMQDAIDEDGKERNLVVDGQQRIRACLEFLAGDYLLDGDDVQARWRGHSFDDLSKDEKQIVFGYKFVVRVLPDMPEEDLRKIFARLNRNVVALNRQELRNATYWGPFIRLVQDMADSDAFWSSAGVFSANDHRRMIDHEFISELIVAHLHGPQNKKDKLDHYYQLYEEGFEQSDDVRRAFSAVTAELSQMLPDLDQTRWCKKSDFYTLFLALLRRVGDIPFPSDVRDDVAKRIREFGVEVDRVVKMDEADWANAIPTAVKYARNVLGAASDRGSRVEREAALEEYVWPGQ